MSDLIRDAACRQLRQMMSDVSEEASCASWEMDLEFSLWNNSPCYWYNGDDTDVVECIELGKALGVWWIWRWDKEDRSRSGTVCIPMAEWLEMFATWKAGTLEVSE